MLQALQETCPWPSYQRVIGIRDVRPDDSVTLPIVMVTRGLTVNPALAPAPPALSDCVRGFMAKVKTPAPDPAGGRRDRFDEDYGFGILDVPEPRNDP